MRRLIGEAVRGLAEAKAITAEAIEVSTRSNLMRLSRGDERLTNLYNKL